MDQDGVELAGSSRVGRPPAPAGAPLPCRVRAIIFDLDGTLLDTEPLYRTAFDQALATFRRELAPADYDRLVGLPSPSRRAMLAGLLGPSFPVEVFLDRYRTRRAAAVSRGIPVKPGANAALRWLRQTGLPFGIATSASRSTALAHLSLAGLQDEFPVVVTRDDVAKGKPAPDSFLAAASHLGAPPHACLAVEDSPAGIDAAYEAGMMVAFIPDSVPCTTDAARHVTVTLDSLHELPALLAEHARATAP